MSSILKHFFEGNMPPGGQFLGTDPVYAELAKSTIRREKELARRLNEEEQALLEKLAEEHAALNDFVAMKSQIYGYSLGVRMMAEVFLARGDIDM